MDTGDIAARLSPPEGSALVLDVDGTLAPIVERPELAAVIPEARGELVRLVAKYRLVGVVSGRPTDEVAQLVGVAGVRYEGLYGLKGGRNVPADVVDKVDDAAGAFPGVWVEHKGASLTVHVREAPDPERAEEQLLPALGKIADHADLELVRGKRSMELAPPGPRKGGAVERLVRDAGARGVLYAGDDLPDLEAFHALDRLEAQGVKTVKVAVQGAETPRELVTAADLIVEGPAGMAALLRLL